MCERLEHVYVFFFLRVYKCLYRQAYGCECVCERLVLLCVSVCLSMSVHAVPPSPLAVCVCHYPAGAALMEAVISNAVN